MFADSYWCLLCVHLVFVFYTHAYTEHAFFFSRDKLIIIVSWLTFIHKVNYTQINLSLRAILAELFDFSTPEINSEAHGCKIKAYFMWACHSIQFQLGRTGSFACFDLLAGRSGNLVNGTQGNCKVANNKWILANKWKKRIIINEIKWNQRDEGHNSKAVVRFLYTSAVGTRRKYSPNSWFFVSFKYFVRKTWCIGLIIRPDLNKTGQKQANK